MRVKRIGFDTPEKRRAMTDVLAALGVPEEEQHDDAIVNLTISKLKSMEDLAPLINYALALQNLDGSGLRTKLLVWGVPSTFVVHELSHLTDSALLRMNIYAYARHLYGDKMAVGGMYQELMQKAMTDKYQ